MGLYMYVQEEDRVSKRKVSDPFINEIFQEALECDPSLMIDSYSHLKRVKRGLFRDKYISETHYNIYHESPAFDGSPYQARLHGCASKGIDSTIAYLYGIINGVMHYQKTNNTNGKPE